MFVWNSLAELVERLTTGTPPSPVEVRVDINVVIATGKLNVSQLLS